MKGSHTRRADMFLCFGFLVCSLHLVISGELEAFFKLVGNRSRNEATGDSK